MTYSLRKILKNTWCYFLWSDIFYLLATLAAWLCAVLVHLSSVDKTTSAQAEISQQLLNRLPEYFALFQVINTDTGTDIDCYIFMYLYILYTMWPFCLSYLTVLSDFMLPCLCTVSQSQFSTTDNKVQFNSIHFSSIQFNSIQFSSFQFSSVHLVQLNSILFNSKQTNLSIGWTVLNLVNPQHSFWYNYQIKMCLASFKISAKLPVSLRFTLRLVLISMLTIQVV